MDNLFSQIADYMEQGGFVMYPLGILTFILWFSLGIRFAALKRGSARSVRVLVQRYKEKTQHAPTGVIDNAVVTALEVVKQNPSDIRQSLDLAFYQTTRKISKMTVLINSIVVVAPLLGLLGTVTGMIETFNSLGDVSMYSQSGGIAGGISAALFTTQLGLTVAIPGLVMGRHFDRIQRTFERELAQIKDIICSESADNGRLPEEV
ncbi:MAG TPA: MotA/TolQ/ExbB proton channel family protein [bacterium]|nr:MotA/TolQ/ExbB proton channel family protein [bacterium]HPS29621.1 MotA/TolQ/ExbB proton channel family protein [bacterium]